MSVQINGTSIAITGLMLISIGASAQTIKAMDSAANRPAGDEKMDVTLNSSVSIGKYLSNLLGADINYSKKGLVIYGNYSNNQLKTASVYTTTRQLYTGNEKITMHDGETDLRDRHINVFKVGSIYQLSAKETIVAEVNGYFLNRDRIYEGQTAIHSTAAGSLDTIISQHTGGMADIRDWSCNLSYQYRIDSAGQVLQIQYFHDSYSQKDYDDFNYTYQSPYVLTQQVKQSLPVELHVNTSRMDYSRNVLKGLLSATLSYNNVSSGASEVFENNQGGKWYYDSVLSTRSQYREQVYGAYGNYSRTFGKMTVAGGVGYEATIPRVGDAGRNGDQKNRPVYWLPSFSLNYSINGNNALYAAYSRTTDRPSYYELTPFKLFIDKYTFRAGNPYLIPSLYNNYSITHTYKQFFYTTINYTHVDNVKFMIQKQNDGTMVLENQFVNLGSLDIATLDFSATKELIRWWSMSASAGVYYTSYRGYYLGSRYDNHAVTAYVENTNVFSIAKKYTVQLHNSYRSATVYGLNKSSGVYYLDASLQKGIFKGNATVNVGVKDLFNTKASYNHVVYQDIDFKYNYKLETRFVFLSVAVKLGKHPTATRDQSLLTDQRITHN
jgi:iron complex outermembrane receptor protein